MRFAEQIQPPKAPAWHVLWTQSHCEQLVFDQLAGRGFEALLPKINVWSKRGGTRHVIRRPMFPGYLFLRHGLDKEAYIEVRKARGLVAVLGDTVCTLLGIAKA